MRTCAVLGIESLNSFCSSEKSRVELCDVGDPDNLGLTAGRGGVEIVKRTHSAMAACFLPLLLRRIGNEHTEASEEPIFFGDI